MIRRVTINIPSRPASLSWYKGELIDWVHGTVYNRNGRISNIGRSVGYKFDAVKQSDNEQYAVVYDKLGTKGVILKDGHFIREINRSFYCADAYEYPVEIFKLKSGEYAIVHCPENYNVIEVEHIESGKKITDRDRKAADCFHSRLQVDQTGTYMLNTGWVWHPYGILELYNLENAFRDNSLFDKVTYAIPINAEVSSACFLSKDFLVIGTSDEESLKDEELREHLLHRNQIGLFNISENRFVKKCSIEQKVGTLTPVDENSVLDLYEYPKLIDLNNGEILEKIGDINSGKQDSSIIHHITVPPMAFTRSKIAIGSEKSIEILEWN